jgi:hypothetical protein
LKESSSDLIKVNSQHLSGYTEKKKTGIFNQMSAAVIIREPPKYKTTERYMNINPFDYCLAQNNVCTVSIGKPKRKLPQENLHFNWRII